jgi:hypothetical protein
MLISHVTQKVNVNDNLHFKPSQATFADLQMNTSRQHGKVSASQSAQKGARLCNFLLLNRSYAIRRSASSHAQADHGGQSDQGAARRSGTFHAGADHDGQSD